MTAVVTISMIDDFWSIRHEFQDGTHVSLPLVRSGESEFRVADNDRGDYYVVRPDGRLDAFDREGFIASGAPLR